MYAREARTMWKKLVTCQTKCLRHLMNAPTHTFQEEPAEFTHNTVSPHTATSTLKSRRLQWMHQHVQPVFRNRNGQVWRTARGNTCSTNMHATSEGSGAKPKFGKDLRQHPTKHRSCSEHRDGRKTVRPIVQHLW